MAGKEGDGSITKPEEGNTNHGTVAYSTAKPIWPFLYLSDIANFKVRSDDVFLLSYAKSGTTWTANILFQVLGRDGENTESSHLFHKITHLEMTQGHDKSKAATTPGFYEKANDMPSPRVLKTHLKLKFLPREIEEKRPKLIYVARNPKDVAVSFFNFTAMTSNCETSNDWLCFLNSFCQNTSPMGPWFDHVTTFWQYRQNHENILYLKYEDMHKNLFDAVARIADFLERPLSKDALEAIVNKSSFHAMKNNPTVNPDLTIPCYAKGVKNRKSFLRKGKVGDWKNYFSVAQNEAFDALYEEKMKDLDLTFDFTL